VNPRLLLLLLATGCGSSAAPAHSPDKASGNPWVDCYAGFAPTGNPRGDVIRLARLCGKPLGMLPVTRVVTKQQRESAGADRYSFPVPSAGSCYRIFAAGDRGISDLDLILRGPDGSTLIGDLTHDAWPILPPQEPLCFDTPGLYMLEVSVFQGSGTYAVQVWGH
jgi:hypothetical protein